MSRRILLYNTMRLNSSRVPYKMLAKIGEHSLAEIALHKMRQCEYLYGIHPIVGICDTDTLLLGLAERANVEIHVRDMLSRDAENLEDGFWDVPRFADRFDWLVNVNFCHPFLRIETLWRLIEAARMTDVPLLSVYSLRGLLWGDNLQPLQQHQDGPNTKTNPSYYPLTNIGGCYPVARMADGPWINANTRPFILPVSPIELVDIDTQEDLEFARICAAGLDIIRDAGTGGTVRRP